jgi:hypothetical protein
MIKLTIVMKPFIIKILLVVNIFIQQIGADITLPVDGDAVRGQVTISGFVGGLDLSKYELSFAPKGTPSTGTWYLISSGDAGVTDGVLGIWDTSSIVDGTYSLRLLVYYNDGSSLEVLRKDIRIRNYTPIETSTPAGILEIPRKSTPTLPSLLPIVAKTAIINENPAAVSPEELRGIWLAAVLITAAVILVAWLYLRTLRR